MSNDERLVTQNVGAHSVAAGHDVSTQIVNFYTSTKPSGVDNLSQRHVRRGLPPSPQQLHGRASELSLMRSRAVCGVGVETAVVPVVIHGLAGVGKSALAARYVYDQIEDHPGIPLVWWVDAEDPGSIPSQCLQLLQEIGEADGVELGRAVSAVHSVLRDFDRWIVVFDNVESPATVGPFVPRLCVGEGAVVITSQNSNGWTDGIAIKPLADDEVGNWLLEQVGSDEREAASKLASMLDGLPLAVAQAAGYCEANSISLSKYCELFTNERARLLENPAGVTAAQSTVSTSLKLCLNKLAEKNDGAVTLLHFCSYLAAARIPFEIFTPVSVGLGSEGELNETIGALADYSLIQKGDDFLYVHRLVQDITRDQYVDEGLLVCETLTGLLDAHIPDSITIDTWTQVEEVVDHVIVLDHHVLAGGELGVEAMSTLARILKSVGLFLVDHGFYERAIPRLERALELSESLHESDSHKDVVANLNNLGGAFHKSQDHERARVCWEKVLRSLDSQASPDPSQLAKARANLGAATRACGNAEVACELLDSALEVQRSDVDMRADCASTLTNLGHAKLNLALFEEATQALEEALAIKTELFGAESPELVSTLTNLGEAAIGGTAGSPSIAIEYLRKALRIQETRYNEQHPDLVPILELLAKAIDGTDQEEAQRCTDRANEISMASLPGRGQWADTPKQITLG